ncbi:MAG: hypothetical protein O8C59_00425 [Candidatus Methanoperedens sp.]|nr:hypothetical protein [Candidatus Methanoperedens sp.]
MASDNQFLRLIGIFIGLGVSRYFDGYILLIFLASALIFVWIAHKKDEPVSEAFLSAFIIALVIGYFGGLIFIILSILAVLCYWIANKIVKSTSKPMLPSFAMQASQGLLGLGLIFSGQLDIADSLLDLVILVAGLTWLMTRPGNGPVVLLTILHLINSLIFLDLFISTEAVSSHRGYLLNVIWRVVAVYLMFQGLQTFKGNKQLNTRWASNSFFRILESK